MEAVTGTPGVSMPLVSGPILSTQPAIHSHQSRASAAQHDLHIYPHRWEAKSRSA